MKLSRVTSTMSGDCQTAYMTSMFRLLVLALLIAGLGVFAFSQEQTKRNDRKQDTGSNVPRPEEDKKASNPTRYSYEFRQPAFMVAHIVIEHDVEGRGNITFERKGEDAPIVEPVELSAGALGRIHSLWTELRFLDSDENYQASKQFPHLGTHQLKMDNGERRRTAKFNWSGNKSAWSLVSEYRRVSEQAILIFNINLAREMRPLNAPQLMDQLESLLKRGEISDPKQLVPLLNELRTDEHIPLIARNHAARLLKKIEK